MVNKGNDIIEKDVERLEREIGGFCKLILDKTFLVTGGCGFIGSYLCETLLRLGGKVICLDNLSSGNLENISHIRNDKNFNFVKHDVKKPFLNYKCDVVLHLASRAARKEWEEQPIEILSTNSIGSFNALELARKNDAQILLTSTSEIYGDPQIVPTPETYNGNVNCISSRSAYDEGKRFAESLFMGYHRQYKLRTAITRIFNTYGPRLIGGIYGRVISKFIQQALSNQPITVYGDGSQTRSFNYITDTADGVIRGIFMGKAGDAYNIGNDNEISIIECAELVKKIIGSSSKITFEELPPDDPKRRCPDLARARKLLKYYPKVKMEDGLKRTIEWIRRRD